jgi:hypothetical protein
MRKIHKKATAIFLVMLMVLGGMTGLLTLGGSKAYAAVTTQTISDENITNVVSSADHKTVTLTTNVYMAPKSGVSVTESVYVTRTGPDGFVSIATDSPVNTVIVTPDSGTNLTVFTLTFETPLTGVNNLIQIQGENYESIVGGQYIGNATKQPLDLQPPAYVGSYSEDGNYVTLKFDEDITLNNVNNNMSTASYLRSKMSISTDGVDFVALPELMYADYGSNEIYLNYNDYDMKVIQGANTRIKIASGTFKDAEGNFNAEMIIDITPPVIQSVAISNENHDVTVTFNESVSENTRDLEGGNLQDYIHLLKSGESTSWVEGDTVTIVDGKLSIHFAQALVGVNNQIAIDGYTLKDIAGNVYRYETKITPAIQIGTATDTAAPKLLKYYLSDDFKDLTFVFDENVESNVSNFDSSIYRYIYGANWGTGINGLGTVEFSANKMIFHFNASLYVSYFQIYSDSLKDTAGNVLGNTIYTAWLNPNNELYYYGGEISHNGRWLNLEFDSDLADNTIVDGISHLKEKIQVSTDQGATFSYLAEDDVVTIQGNRLVVIFHDAKTSGTIQVKVDAEAVSNLHIPTQKSGAINEVIAYNTPDLKGYFFSNAASEFIFEDDGVWSAKVRDVFVYDDETNVERRLTSSEYTLTAGKLTINQGIFQEGNYYDIYIDADGYSSKDIGGAAFNSSKLFYMTAPVISTQGGILAKVNILRNDNIDTDYGSTQTVVFEMMNGLTPVSIVASELDVYTGTYSALFNVTDAATTNYTVKAFVVSKFNNDYTNVGLNMTTQVTQTEYDVMLNDQLYNGGGW